MTPEITDIPIPLEAQLSPNDQYTNFDVPIFKALNGWNTILPFLQPGNFLVVFESIRKPNATDNQPIGKLLEQADAAAYEEVTSMPGFLGYFRGPLDNTSGACRSFCIWEDEATAKISGQQPKHQDAVNLTSTAYDQYRVRRYTVVESNGQLMFEGVFPRRDQRGENNEK